MTVANLITAIRIILAPIFIIYLINDQFLSALVVFALCVISDGVDGMIARLLKQKSRLGAILDPIADKLLLIAGFITLSIMGFIPSWLTVMAISRDVLILLGIFVLFIYKIDIRIRPTVLSKINTCLQFVVVIAVLSKDYLVMAPILYALLFYLTAFFTISSGLHYMHYGFRLIGEGTGERFEK